MARTTVLPLGIQIHSIRGLSLPGTGNGTEANNHPSGSTVDYTLTCIRWKQHFRWIRNAFSTAPVKSFSLTTQNVAHDAIQCQVSSKGDEKEWLIPCRIIQSPNHDGSTKFYRFQLYCIPKRPEDSTTTSTSAKIQDVTSMKPIAWKDVDLLQLQRERPIEIQLQGSRDPDTTIILDLTVRDMTNNPIRPVTEKIENPQLIQYFNDLLATENGHPSGGKKGSVSTSSAPPNINSLGSMGKLATAINRNRPKSYYEEQCSKYFDTLASNKSITSIPDYWDGVIRWEWPPWLLLTGKGKVAMIGLDALLKLYPTVVPIREFKVFDVQPFGRSRVTFYYGDSKDPVHIYEEFSFNERGEMTFIEAWTDQNGLLPVPNKKTDPWAERKDALRLSTMIPGLGNSQTEINIKAVSYLAQTNDVLKVFLQAYEHPIFEWDKELFRYVTDPTKDNTFVHKSIEARKKAVSAAATASPSSSAAATKREIGTKTVIY